MFESIAYAQGGAPASGGAGPFVQLLPLLLFFAIFYFLLIRPQRQHQQKVQKMVAALKKGDKVITAGGIIGTVTSVQNDYVVLKIGENESTKVEILKSAVTGLREADKS